MWIIYDVAEASGYQKILSLEEAAAIQPTVWRDVFYIRETVTRMYHYIEGEKGAEQPSPAEHPKDPRANRARRPRR